MNSFTNESYVMVSCSRLARLLRSAEILDRLYSAGLAQTEMYQDVDFEGIADITTDWVEKHYTSIMTLR